MLILDKGGESAEFVSFVHQDYGHLGIGTLPCGAAIAQAGAVGFKTAWLTVAFTNVMAVRL